RSPRERCPRDAKDVARVLRKAAEPHMNGTGQRSCRSRGDAVGCEQPDAQHRLTATHPHVVDESSGPNLIRISAQTSSNAVDDLRGGRFRCLEPCSPKAISVVPPGLGLRVRSQPEQLLANERLPQTLGVAG